MDPCVLVVDDSPTLRTFLRFVLKTQGCRVFMARDGMEALELLARERVDLMITDLSMPNMDGYELVRCIREEKQQRELPIIALCSEQRTTEWQKALELGVHSCLVKPFTASTICQEVTRCLGSMDGRKPSHTIE